MCVLPITFLRERERERERESRLFSTKARISQPASRHVLLSLAALSSGRPDVGYIVITLCRLRTCTRESVPFTRDFTQRLFAFGRAPVKLQYIYRLRYALSNHIATRLRASRRNGNPAERVPRSPSVVL